MPVISGVYLKDFPALPSSVVDANIIPIAESGNQVAYRTTVGGIVTDARVTGKVLTGLSVTGGAIASTDTILQAFGKVQNQLNNRVTSVGLSMPSAFTVTNSPVTGSGTLTVTGAGLATQYIRGDGQLADFPTGGGGGSSVSYYLNGSVNQGTFSGNTYYEMNKNAILGAGTDFTISADGYIASFITDANDPNLLLIPGGNWNLEFYFSASSGGGSPSFYVELSKWNGSSFTAIANNSSNPELIAFGTSIQPYFATLAVPETVMNATDRLAIRVYVNHSGRTITLHTENNHLCQIITTFTTGLQSLNGLTKQTQFFSVGTSGTDFNISSATDTHTFNIPSASATNRGLVTTGTQTFAGDKTFTGNINATPTTGNAIQANTTTSVAIQTSSTSGDGVSATATTGSAIRGSTSGTLGIGVHGNASGTGGIGGEFIGSSNAGYAVYAQASGSTTVGVYATANSSTAPVLRSIQSGSGSIALFDNSGGTVATITNSGGLTMAGVLTQTVGTSESKLTTTAGSGLEIRSDGSTAADRNIRFTLGTTEQAIINNSGNLGLGIPSPETRLHLSGDLTQQTSLNSTSQFFLILRKSRGTIASPLTVNVNDEAGGILFAGYDGATWRTGAAIRARVQAVSAGSLSSNLEFYAGNGSPSAGVHVLTMRGDTQNVLVGTTTDAGYKLDVNGTGRFSGALTGTSATFSGNGAFGGSVALTGIGGGIAVDHATTSGMQMRVAGNVKGYVYTTSTKLILECASGVGIDMYVNGGGSPSLAIASTGAATFSSTVSATQGLFSIANNAGVQVRSGNTSNYTYIALGRNSDEATIGIPAATDQFMTGAAAGDITINNTSGKICLGTAAVTRLAITSGGNVGIGTTSPNQPLHVAGTAVFTGTTLSGNTAAGVYIIDQNIYSLNGGNSRPLSIQAETLTFFSGTSYTERMRITAGGEVYIAGTTDQGAYNLQCNGTGVWGAGAYENGSDLRLKEDIKPILSGLDYVNKMNPVSFKYLESYSKDRSIQTGFIAQELQEVFKDEEWVEGIVKKGNEHYNVAYQNIIPILVKAIQEQQLQIEALKSK